MKAVAGIVMRTDGRGDGSIGEAGLYRLMTWLSPGFPVGAYSYSHGLEYAVEAGLVSDGDGLRRWVEGIIAYGAGRIDADLFRDAWRSVDADDRPTLARVAERASALRGSAEMALESRAQGTAFLETVLATSTDAAARRWLGALAEIDPKPAYAVAVAVAAAAIAAPLAPSLTAYLHGFAANLISAGVRLIPLGQTDGQRALARLEAPVLAASATARARGPEDFGAAAMVVDWASVQHETQYTRLFRS
jgi:urease accessory protein